MDATHRDNKFVRKLSTFGGLSHDDETALARATSDVRQVDPHELMVEHGESPSCAHAILEGFACRYKFLPDGNRQILDFLVPGDLCDGHALFLATMDHSVGSLSRCRVAFIPHKVLLDLTDRHPALARALWWSALVQESTAREWIANIGRRSGEMRIAHLLCELCFRLNSVGLAPAGEYRLPITQADLADATGLSTVHTNRMLQKLRAAGLISLSGDRLSIRDLSKLEEYCGFDESYLHLQSERRPQSRGKKHALQANLK